MTLFWNIVFRKLKTIQHQCCFVNLQLNKLLFQTSHTITTKPVRKKSHVAGSYTSTPTIYSHHKQYCSSVKSVPKSPRTVKKERGIKLVKKARETIAKRDRTRQSEGEGRRLTRGLRERIETEKFHEAKLQALYKDSGVEGLVRSEKHPSKRLRRHKRKHREEEVVDSHKRHRHSRCHSQPTTTSPPLDLPDISPPKRSRRSLQLDTTSTVIDLTVPGPSPVVCVLSMSNPHYIY